MIDSKKCLLCNKPAESEYLCRRCANTWKKEIIKTKENHSISPRLSDIYKRLIAVSFEDLMEQFAYIDDIPLGEKTKNIFKV